MAYILNTASNLDSYVKAACRPSADEPNRLFEIFSQAQFKAGRTISNPDSSITVVSGYTENIFSFSQFDLQNDGLIIAIDWTPGAHTDQYEGSYDYRLISIRNQAAEDGNTVEMLSNDTSGYTNDFFVSRSSSTVKDTQVSPTPPSRTRQVSYIHYSLEQECSALLMMVLSRTLTHCQQARSILIGFFLPVAGLTTEYLVG